MSAVPISRPHIGIAPRKRARSRTYISTRELCVWAALFGVIASVVFGASSLSGHVLVESARRQSIQANQRLRVAVAAQNDLSREIEYLSDNQALVAWAVRNGFDAPELLPRTSGRGDAVVARR